MNQHMKKKSIFAKQITSQNKQRAMKINILISVFVKVFNTLGQRLATVQGDGEQLTADISSLPAGIYFVNITDNGGRKCVRKVVKE